MALLDFTGFNGVSTSTLDRRASAAPVNAAIGATGRYGRGLTLSGTNAEWISPQLATPLATIIVGISVKFVSGDAKEIYLLDTAAGVTHLDIVWDESNERVALSTDGAVHFTSANASVPADTWVFLEVLLTVHASAGVVTFRINGTQVYAGTGLDTQRAAGTTVDCVGVYNPDGSTVIDCVYLQDTTGSAPHNTFLGPVRCDASTLGADSTPTDWAPSSGSSSKDMVDDGDAPDDDSTYVASSTVGQNDLITQSFSPTSRFIYGYRVHGMMKASAADGRQVALVHVDGTPTVQSDQPSLTTGYTEQKLIIEESLTRFATLGAAVTAIGAMEIGYELVA